ncbi:MFS transporter [Nocardioides sp. LHG3406-4]|uniref:MFS transporter n=1 Tax=Nocardioides sp. LHG3406-4 TaxID=2804575 RepID=UPI003CF7CFE3
MLSRLGFPSIGPHRRFVTAIAVDALGSGVFMPLTMLYFLAVTPLSLLQVGAAISIASAVSLPAGPVLGALVDRFGAKQVLLAGNALQAAGFVAYLFTESFAAVLLWTIVVTVGRTAFWGSYGNIVAAISRPGERERWFGFLGALRNVGFAVGGVASGIALAIGTDLAFEAVVAANAATYVVAFWLLLAVPATARGGQQALPGSWRTVLADRPYRLLVVAQMGYSMPMMVLNFAMPVYVVEVLDLPGWITGVIFTVNCIMVGLGQGLVVNAMTGRVRSRVLLLTQAVFAASFVVFLVCGWLAPAVATGPVVLGGIVYTLAELTGGPVLAALSAEASPDHLRGRYLSLIQLAWNLSGTIAPVLFAWLLDRGPEPLWVLMLALAAVTVLVVNRLAAIMPAAAARVTNQAEPVAS